MAFRFHCGGGTTIIAIPVRLGYLMDALSQRAEVPQARKREEWLHDQKKIVNEVKIDSGLKLSSINGGQTFGDMFLSYQRDINVGTNFSLFGAEKSKLNIKLSKLYTIGTKSLFYENLKIDFPDPFSLKIDYRANERLHYLYAVVMHEKSDPPSRWQSSG